MPYRYRLAHSHEGSPVQFLGFGPFGWFRIPTDREAKVMDTAEQAMAALERASRELQGSIYIQSFYERDKTASEEIQEQEDRACFAALDEYAYKNAKEARYGRRREKLLARLLGLLEWRMKQVWRTSWDHVLNAPVYDEAPIEVPHVDANRSLLPPIRSSPEAG